MALGGIASRTYLYGYHAKIELAAFTGWLFVDARLRGRKPHQEMANVRYWLSWFDGSAPGPADDPDPAGEDRQ